MPVATQLPIPLTTGRADAASDAPSANHEPRRAGRDGAMGLSDQPRPEEPPPQRASNATADDALLARRAMGGDDRAFGELIDRHERAALAVAYGVTRESALACDAVQEACLKAWRRRGDLADPQRFAGWFLQTVRRCAADQMRAMRRRPRTMDELPQDSGESDGDALLDSERQERVQRALAALDEPTRLAVAMRYYDDRSSREIADVLGCTPAAVDMRLSRARERLRGLLAPLSG